MPVCFIVRFTIFLLRLCQSIAGLLRRAPGSAETAGRFAGLAAVLPLVFATFFATGFAVVAQAGPYIPPLRYQAHMDTDYYGSDLQALFDTDLASCQAACSAQQACAGFSYNTRSNACFPKQQMQTSSPFVGAISALKQTQPTALLAQAETRAQRLGALREADFKLAYKAAEEMARRFPNQGAALEDMVEAAQIQARGGNTKGALRWLAQAVALSDEAGLWAEYSAVLLRHSGVKGVNKRETRKQALAAGLNAYLRAPSAAVQVNGLVTAAQALEKLGRGRDMLPLLRLAEEIAPRRDTARLLERGIEKYGFRVTDSRVDSDSATPRLCVEFSDPLLLSGVSYEDYIKLSAPGIVAIVEDRELCVEGLEHGRRYRMTLRSGLPGGNGDALIKDVELTHYISDRSPALRFPGRAYVLAKTDQAALPIETVNLTEVTLQLRRVSDRNLLRSMQDGYFGRPLSQWQEEHFASDIAEDVWSGTATVQSELNQDMTTRLPLAEAIAGQPVGIYALFASYEGADPYEEPSATQWFVLTDLGLSTMSGSDGLHVQVQGLSDAKPRAGVEVTLISNANAVLGKALSDDTGYAHFEPGLARGRGGAAVAMIQAQVIGADGAEDFAFLSLKDAAFDLSDRGVEGRPSPGPVDVFLATDRGAYRAGEVIHATALTRDSRAQAIEDLPLTAILTRPDGVEYSRHVSAAGKVGGHVFDLPVGSTAPRGTWRLEIKTDVKAAALASRQILVEDFMPERIDFDQSIENVGDLRPGEFAQLDISARYLFGAPGADLGIDGDLRLRPTSTLEQWPGYHFGRFDAPRDSQRNYFGGDRTDASGAARVTVELPVVQTTGMPFEATLTTRLTDGSGRPVERNIDLPVRSSGPVLGIKPLFEEVVAEGTEAGFELLALSEDQQPMPMRVKWSLNRIETRYHWYQLYGDWNWERSTRRISVATGEAQLEEESPFLLSTPVDWGRYELVIERLDGDYVEAALDFYAGWYAPADASATPDRLEMSLDADSYQPGEVARLRLVPQSAGTALISVLSNRVIERHAVEVEAGEVVVPLTISQDWGSGAYVTAMMLQPLTGKTSRTPTRALGLAHATVTQPGQELQVVITVPEVARPRSTETAQITVTGAKPGEPVWLTLAAVDLGILNLTGFKTPDPSSHYHGQRRLGMELRDIYGRLIDPGNGALGQVRSGGDADRGLQMQSPPPTQDLVAFFSGAVQVGPDGGIAFPMELPAFNGTVRLMAMAWSKEAVGQAEADMLVRDPVVVTASLPRFLAPGDQSRISIEMVHADGPTGEMTLLAQSLGSGLSLGALPGSITLGPQGKAVLELPVTATEVGDPEVVLSLITPDDKHLSQVLRLPVRANDPVQASTRRFTLNQGSSFQLTQDVFAGYRPGTARAVLSAGPLAKFDVPGLLESLDQYPYGCTEQVTSKAMPLLYLSSVAQSLGLGRGPEVRARIKTAIQRVLTRQAGNGAFGLWRAETGDFWLDAYVSDFLSRARRQGHDVPEAAFVRAMDNLRNRLNYASDFDEGGEDVAYALLVLAREGAASMGDLRYYADVKAGAFATPLAAAQLGAALAAYGDQRRADRMFARAGDLLQKADREDPVWRADYGTRRRDAAAVLTLVAEAGTEAVSAERLSRRISSDTGPMSTQESTWTLLAAHALIKNPEASGMRINGQPTEGAFVQIHDGQGPVDMSVTSASGAVTDLTLTTLGVPVQPPEAGGYGYTIERSYFSLEGQELDGAAFKVGDRFVTVLRVTPHETVGARLMINDPLAAGIEIDNPNLLRSGDLRDLDWLNPSEAEHAEFRSDRFLAAVDLSGRKPATLAYISRAVTPGRFHRPAAQVEDMYRPAYRAHTAAGSVVIR